MPKREVDHRLGDAIHESDLKICDLCGALNLAENGECFVCGWHGHFDTSPRVIRIAMELVRRKYGALDADSLSDHHIHAVATSPSLRWRLVRLFLRFKGWLFG